MSVKRSPGNYGNLVRDQYSRLQDAVGGFYEGKKFDALNIATTIRVLVHDTPKSPSLLSHLCANYWDLDIYHKPTNPKAVFVVKQTIRLSGDGTSGIVRDGFDSGGYQLVPLKRWWEDDYLIIGANRSSKKQIILDVANKDGGAHVDKEVPARHAMASEPPFRFGVVTLAGQQNFIQPNLAHATVAQAGNELLDYLQRHALFTDSPSSWTLLLSVVALNKSARSFRFQVFISPFRRGLRRIRC